MLPFGIGFLVYSIIAYASYIKFRVWYHPYVIGMSLGCLSNGIWMYIAQSSKDRKEVLFKGLIWDFMITGIYLAVPLLLLDMPSLMWYNKLGIVIIIIGLILLKT